MDQGASSKSVDEGAGALPADWATWQLLDSLLPTGGFAHSYGLEAALHAGLLVGGSGLQAFIVSVLESVGSLLLPFVFEGHRTGVQFAEKNRHRGDTSGAERTAEARRGRVGLPDGEVGGKAAMVGDGEWSEEVGCWVEMDAILHAMMANHIARRASCSQGTALLRVAAALFPETGLLQEMRVRARKSSTASKSPRCSEPQDGAAKLAAKEKSSKDERASDKWYPHMHHAPVFGIVAGLANMDARAAQRAYLFLGLRDLLSAATRLNIIGPLEAAVLQRNLASRAEAVLNVTADRPISSAHQIAPLLDIVQGGHDALFSRLFST